MTSKKRLLYFDFVTHFGGAQNCMVDVCRMLANEFDVNVVDAYGCCSKFGNAIKKTSCRYYVLFPEARKTTIGKKNYPVERFTGFMSAVPELLKVRSRLASTVKEIGPDVIITSSAKSIHLLWSVLCFSKTPTLYYLHGNYRRDQISKNMRFLFCRFVDYFIAVSSVTKRNICDLGIDPSRVKVVFNSIDVGQITQQAEKPLEGPLSGLEYPIRILLPATLLRSKGQLCAIKAVHLLRERKHEVVLWLAGDMGRGADTSILDTLKSEVSRLGLEKNVFFLGWRSDIPSLMANATVVILPSHTEGLPKSIIEAMALGKPVVATSVGGIPDLIKDGETGLLVDVDAHDALAQAIEKYCDHDFTKEIINSAHEHIKKHFIPELQQETLINVLREVISNTKN